MVKLQEHRIKMEMLQKEIKQSKGLHKKDLMRQYNRMLKELQECEMHLWGNIWQRN